MQPRDGRTLRTRVARQIDADPTSTALLLAGPTALDLWPGLRRVGEAGGRLLVEAELAGAPPLPAAATVRAEPPRRTPTSYVTTFAWTGPGLPMTRGELVLHYAPGALRPGTTAQLTLDSEGVEASRVSPQDLEQMATAFLGNLAAAAEARCHAA